MLRKKKQLYAAILTLAAVALLMDRALRGGSLQTARAATARSLEALGVETSAAPGTSVVASPFPGALPDKSAEELRNLFVLSDEVRSRMLGLGSSDTSGRGRAGQRRKGGITPAAVFEREHKLSGTIVGDGVSFAIVDGAWFRIGDRLDNCQVTAITGTSVTWKCADGLSNLSVMGDSSASGDEK